MKAGTLVQNRPLSRATQDAYCITGCLSTYKTTYILHKLGSFSEWQIRKSNGEKCSSASARDNQSFQYLMPFLMHSCSLMLLLTCIVARVEWDHLWQLLTTFTACHQLEQKCTALIIIKTYIIFLYASTASFQIIYIKYEKEEFLRNTLEKVVH